MNDQPCRELQVIGALASLENRINDIECAFREIKLKVAPVVRPTMEPVSPECINKMSKVEKGMDTAPLAEQIERLAKRARSITEDMSQLLERFEI